MNGMNSGGMIPGISESREAFLAAVGTGPAAEYLIREAAAVARGAGASLVVLHVQKPGKRAGTPPDRLRALAALARGAGAELAVLTAARIGKAVAQFAAENGIGTVVLGKSRRGFPSSFSSPARELSSASRPFRVLLVPNPAAPRGGARGFPAGARRSPLQYAAALVATGLVTGFNLLLAPAVGYRAIALFYLLFVSFGALFLRVGPVVLAAVSSALLWNYLFIPPLHTFTIARFEDVFMFVVYVVIAVLVGGLTSRLRAREQVMERAEKKISALYDLSRELGLALDRDGIARAAVKCLDRYFAGRTALLLPEPSTGAGSAALFDRHPAGTLALTEDETRAVQGAPGGTVSPGEGTTGQTASPIWSVPLGSPSAPLGVLAVLTGDRKAPSPESENFLRGASSLIALALERDASLRRSEAARLAEESERLYRTLFNLISHELRTPLTTIQGAATSLAEKAVDGRPETRRALYAEIRKAGERLNLLFANLLSMSRIESGFLRPEKRPHDLRDLVGAALDSLDDPPADRLFLDIPDDLPACTVDFDFMKQVFVNLLQNAVRYAGPRARITVGARADGGGAVVTIADDGPGWAPGALPRLFEKFRRGGENRTGGLGLGLSICRGIVEAHGGTITAANAPGGGAEIRIRLPECPPPAAPAGEDA